MRDTITLRQHAGWQEIRIDREAQRNALDRATRESLHRALDAARADARAIVLTGTGGSFCAGLDLKERETDKAAGRPDTAGEEAIALNVAIRDHPAVVIAAVNGMALGGGLTLINSCDLALAASDATLACPEIGFATYASMAGPTSQLLLTRKRAAWLLLTNERLDAATAERWGLINEVVPPADLLSRARRLAERMAGFDPVALAETKKALSRVPGETRGWREAMEFGQTVNAAIRSRTQAAAAGLARFAAGGRNPGQGS
ncbi:enoyl-CoA hydratase [Variovorax sp. WS11]|uniref:enoyl-CoA hydratase/isomerase family protein n=1 Tax=Variovorax sp. WS11 TaxID=1105204 RepID=UPI000D0D040E|nr:enoyl-CoA hydratase/isomerase family protein [Variovorax sp. WS11]NDZ18095.1 enoyl-CoA hydratase/isomerase family protein [Variovorax sp. WS11]PSL79252.1 enoyl-CoA hydratase [Variovorax sp. WS11]